MLRGDSEIARSNFRDDANSSKGLDTRRRHNKVELRKIFFSSCENQRFQIEFAQFKTVHVGTDDTELFRLFFTHLSVHGGEHLFIGRFHAFGSEAGNIRNFLRWIFQDTGSDCEAALRKHPRRHRPV